MKVLIYTLVLLLITSPLWAVGVTVGKGCIISWDANTEADLAGYKLFVGKTPGSYGPAQTIAAPAQSITCAGAGITADGQYYITLAAYDKINNESAKAAEVPFTVDGATPVVPVGLKVSSS